MPRPPGVAFLLAQLGWCATARFAERLAALDLTPELVGVLRVVGQEPGLSQQALAQRLGTLPSKVVRLVDDLEERGLLERRRSTTDRRNHELHVVADAGDRLDAVLAAVAEHDAEMTRGLTATERSTLAGLLGRIAAEQGIDPQAHPGHRAHRRGERP